MKKDFDRQVASDGLINEEPLPPEQQKMAIDYAVRLGVPIDVIHISDAMNTSYKMMFGIEALYIGTDVLPTTHSAEHLGANSKIGMFAALAHEIIGHRQAEMSNQSQNDELLEEVQASIRAAKFAPDLPLTERILLLRDAVERLHKNGVRLKNVREKLWLEEEAL